MRIIKLSFFYILTSCLVVALASAQDRIYSAKAGEIIRNDLDTSSGTPDAENSALILSGSDPVNDDVVTPNGMAFDTSANKLYWADSGLNTDNDNDTGELRRSDLDGSNPETVVQEVKLARSVCVDSENGFVFWTEEDTQITGARRMRRATTSDFSSPDLVAIGLSSGGPEYCDVGDDADGDPQVCWTDTQDADIKCRPTDLSSSATSIFSPSNGFALSGIAIDSANQKIYYGIAAANLSEVRRVNFDGSSDTQIFDLSSSGFPQGMDVSTDVGSSGTFCFADLDAGITCSDLDGDNSSLVLTSAGTNPEFSDVQIMAEELPETTPKLDEGTTLDEAPELVSVSDNGDGTAEVTISLQAFDATETESATLGGRPIGFIAKGESEVRYAISIRRPDDEGGQELQARQTKLTEVAFSRLSGNLRIFYQAFDIEGPRAKRQLKKKLNKKIKKLLKKGKKFKAAIKRIRKKGSVSAKTDTSPSLTLTVP